MSKNLIQILPVLKEFGIRTDYIGDETTLEELELDSLGVYDLALGCEDKFNIEIIDEDELGDIKTIGQFADLVNRKIKGK